MLAKRIGFLGFEGVTASDLVAPADTFAIATLDSGYGNRIPCYQTYTIGLTSEPFRTESGMIFAPEQTLEAISELDTILVPGGRGLRKPELGERIADWILTRANRTRRIAAISTGIYGLAPTGLLDGREVTTHWRFASDVARRFPKLRVDHRRPLLYVCQSKRGHRSFASFNRRRLRVACCICRRAGVGNASSPASKRTKGALETTDVRQSANQSICRTRRLDIAKFARRPFSECPGAESV